MENSGIIITDKRGTNKAAEDAQPVEETETPAPQPPQRRAVATAFAIIMELDGTVSATGDITALADVLPQRQASFHDMYSATMHIQKDITCQETAMRVLHGFQQQAQMAMEQARVQQQMAGLDLSGHRH